jgi:hypothetical protein
LAAISSLFAFRELGEPGAASPMPRGRAAGMRASGERAGLLGHVGQDPIEREMGWMAVTRIAQTLAGQS